MLVHAFHERVIVDFAEALGEGDLLLGCQRLVAEKDHKMLEPSRLYFPERFIIQPIQVDVGDFGAERSCDRLDFDPPMRCHGLCAFRPGYWKGQANGSTARVGRAWTMLRLEPTNDKVDHLIQSGAGLIRAFRDQLRMEEANHRRACANRRKIHIGHLKLAGSDTIRDHLGYDARDAVYMRSANVPIFLHGDGDHLMHFRVGDIAVCTYWSVG